MPAIYIDKPLLTPILVTTPTTTPLVRSSHTPFSPTSAPQAGGNTASLGSLSFQAHVPRIQTAMPETTIVSRKRLFMNTPESSKKRNVPDDSGSIDLSFCQLR